MIRGRYLLRFFALLSLPISLSGCASNPTPGSLRPINSLFQVVDGGIIRGRTDQKRIALVFTAHEFAEGGDTILNNLAKNHAHASFFLTGAFLTNSNFSPLVRRMARDGHYLGPHSDEHLLYCPWEGEKRTLVSKDVFRADLQRNLDKLERADVAKSRIRYFLPPYEHYNRQIVEWAGELGLCLVNFTPGTRSNADYTNETDRNFVPSNIIFESIQKREQQDPHGLNGFILLLHLGAGPGRTDKFSNRFAELLDFLSARGYEFVSVDDLLAAP